MLQLISDKKQTLKEFTENNYAQASFFWNYLLKNKEIKVNGQRVSANVPLFAGDVVCYYLAKKQEEKAAFYTVYKDENVWLVDKESGVNSEAVFAALLREQTAKGETCYFIHRLDRNTRGLLAFALNEETESALLQAFKQRQIEKKYHALCYGMFPKKTDVLTAYLKKNGEKALVQVFDEPKSGAEKIVTEYAVLRVNEDGTTQTEVTLHTGKTHQIRAHLAHVGCPIVGDMKYGNTAKNKEMNAARQCLVAKELHFFLDGALAYLNEKTFTSRFDVNER
ncbi:MAG: RluA family pseudouridine synthase [Clostridia bacterium]|nr:RluA family pseudouridine synthase [Clostridia bacterium]